MKISETARPWDYIDARQRADLVAAMIQERIAMRAHRDYQRSTRNQCERFDSVLGEVISGTCLQQLAQLDIVEYELNSGFKPDQICLRCKEVTRLKQEHRQAVVNWRKVRDRIWRKLRLEIERAKP